MNLNKRRTRHSVRYVLTSAGTQEQCTSSKQILGQILTKRKIDTGYIQWTCTSERVSSQNVTPTKKLFKTMTERGFQSKVRKRLQIYKNSKLNDMVTVK